ncbi:MAG: sensor histidine kinase [Oscillospiraceae bacterium]|nr:sensor histidine kinase [Oscillospiraceae bacterium]MDD4369335.1 sensor histidine kinase [Oscillospiraceae bacterium]
MCKNRPEGQPQQAELSQPGRTERRHKYSPRRRSGRLRTLRVGMVVLILACWALPSFLMLGVFSYYTSRSIDQSVDNLLSGSVTNAADVSRRNLDNLIQASFDVNYSTTVRQALADYRVGLSRDGQAAAQETLRNTFNRFLTQSYSRRDDVRTVMVSFLDDPQNLTFFSYNPTLGGIGDVNYFRNHVLTQALDKAQTLGSDVTFLAVDGRVYLLRNLLNYADAYQPYAVMAMELIPETICESLYNLDFTKRLYVSCGDTPFLSMAMETAAETAQAEQTASGAAGFWRDLLGLGRGERRLTLSGAATGSRYTLSYRVTLDPSSLLLQQRQGRRSILYMAVLLLPLIGAVLFYLQRKVSRPIRRLTEQSRAITRGAFGSTVDSQALGSREFAYLGENFNTMSLRLQNQFERIYQEELALRDAQIKALQSQINPHFLGNTLEIINWEARLKGETRLSRMLEALSTMLEATTDRHQKAFITLAEEMTYVHAYLYIIGERLGSRLTITEDLDPTLADLQVPRLILQPIVENAVEHGIFQQPHGQIWIRTRRLDETWILLQVENDQPLSAEDEVRIRRLLGPEEVTETHATNIGIRNVHRRLRMIYGETSGLNIYNNAKGHTVSDIKLHELAKT